MKEKARIIINNYKLGFFGCKNEHNINDIFINDFKKTQFFDGSKIICQNCNKLNDNILNNICLCLKCNQTLCGSCISIHDKTHNIINFQEKYFICNLHYESYNSYCFTCKKDLCPCCNKEHEKHTIISNTKMISDISKDKEEIKIFFEKKECLKKDINDIINKFQNLINSIDNFFELYENIINFIKYIFLIYYFIYI